jgi:hypothetical protein
VPDDALDTSGRVVYLVISGAPAPEGISALVGMLQCAGWRVVMFATPLGIRFVDAVELEDLTGEISGTYPSATPSSWHRQQRGTDRTMRSGNVRPNERRP